jgi:hypothetical protein
MKIFPAMSWFDYARKAAAIAIGFSIWTVPPFVTAQAKTPHPANPQGGFDVGTPTVSPSVTDEGSTTFDVNGTFTEGNGGFALYAEVEWGDGSSPDSATISGNFSYSFHGTHTYAQNGSYEVFVRVNNSGESSSSDSVVVTVNNVTPTVDTPLVSPTTVDEGSVTNFSVSGSFNDPGGVADQPYSVVVDWGDGNTDTATVSGDNTPFTYSFDGNHTYAQDGSYFVTVSVTDQDGSTGTSNSTTISVNNAAPAVAAPQVSPANLNEGTEATFSVSGSFSDPGGASDEPYTVVVDWGDGTTDQASVAAAGFSYTYSFNGFHTYSQDGPYPVKVSVTDQNGSTSDSDTTAVFVDNVTPMVDTPTVSPPTTEGTSTFFNVSGTFSDPGGTFDEPYAAVIDWGDGTTDYAIVSGGGNPYSYSFNGSHTYAQNGSYSVTVSVTDQNGSTGTSNAATATVTNVAPTVDTPFVSPAKTTEGTETGFSVSGTFFDPAGALDQPYTAVVNWGDGTPTDTASVDVNSFSYSFNGNHTYAEEGTYNVTVSVTDKDGATGVSNASSVTVSHVVPIVTNTNDSGDGSLRQALADANDGDTITFNIPPVTPTVPAVANVITLTTGELVVDKNVIISGPGANVLEVTRDPNASAFRIFHVMPGHTVSIEGMTISNGIGQSAPFIGNAGGGIYNDHATLTVNGCTLSGNSGTAGGGGILSDGHLGNASLTVMNSTLSGNQSGSAGGGIYSFGQNGNVAMAVANTTFTNNTSFGGGGIFTYAANGVATLAVANSTFHGNTANGPGGGIYNLQQGGGVAIVEIGNTILDSTDGGILNIGGSITSHGYNLSNDPGVTNASGGAGSLNATGDQTNTDPMLGPLKDNGGPTLTHAPLINSPAIDQGKRDTIPGLTSNFDQRGFTRPINDPAVPNANSGDGSDIGAAEVGAFVHPNSATSSKTHGGAGTFEIPLALTGPAGIECRSAGPGNAYRLIVNFPLSTSITNADVTSGTGSVSSFTPGPGNQLTIDLTGVTNAQTLTIALFGANDGNNIADVGVRMGVLIGDTVQNGQVNATDVSNTKLQSGQPVGPGNFRNDVTANGTITSTDVSLVKSRSGSGLP